jgi:hypothetical protein
MRFDSDVPIELEDGLVLRADVFRPDDDEPYPVLLSYGPYAKGLHFEDGYPDQWRRMCEQHPDVPAGSSNRFAAWELADPEKWVPHGYVCVRVDSRGAGSSPGDVDPWSPREAQDLYECIEWAAVQPWSTGKVGLTGVSYYAMNQWQAAALQPPSLTAICPWEGSSDIYREMARQGGMHAAFIERWYPNQIATVQHGLGERAKKSRVTGKGVAGEETLSDEQLEASRIDFGAVVREHAFDDEYWQARRPDLSKITVPMLSAANWGGPPHLRGNIEGFLGASSEQKWLECHGLEHWTHYYTDYGRELQKEFFDHFLKGEDNGWDKRPPVILNARRPDGSFEHRAEQDWPLPQTQWTTFYLDTGSARLVREPLGEPASVSYEPLEDGVTFRLTAEEELEVTGPMAAKLFVESATEDADLFVILRLFDPDGEECYFIGTVDPAMALTHGWLRASHRKLDPERSTPERPYHPHDEKEPLTPGAVYELDVEIWPTSIVVPAGYTLALTIQGTDYDHGPIGEASNAGWSKAMGGVGPFVHVDPDDRPPAVFGGTVTVHAGGDRSSYLLLPVIPRG